MVLVWDWAFPMKEWHQHFRGTISALRPASEPKCGAGTNCSRHPGEVKHHCGHGNCNQNQNVQEDVWNVVNLNNKDGSTQGFCCSFMFYHQGLTFQSFVLFCFFTGFLSCLGAFFTKEITFVQQKMQSFGCNLLAVSGSFPPTAYAFGKISARRSLLTSF